MTTAETYAFGGGAMTVLVPGAVTGNAFAVLVVDKPEGNATPPHSHDEETELIYVLAGTIGVETEGRRETLALGAIAVLPPGRAHRLTNTGEGTAREFLLCTPPAFDRYVAALGVPAGSGFRPLTEDDKRRMAEAAPRFGIRLLDPAALQTPARPATAHPPDRLDVMGARLEVLARLGSADDDLVLLGAFLAPGKSVPLHRHADLECIFLISGALDVYAENEGWRQLGPEQAKLFAPSVGHAIRNTGPAMAQALMVTTVRIARFFATVGAPATGPDPLPPSAEQLAAFPGHVAAFGYWTGSPEENTAIGLPHHAG